MENEDLSLHFSVIELMGLTGERLMEFVDKNCTPERKSFVEETLNKNPLLKSVCTITFYCASLCLLLAEHSVQIPQLKTYTRITAYIMEVHIFVVLLIFAIYFMCRFEVNSIWTQRANRNIQKLDKLGTNKMYTYLRKTHIYCALPSPPYPDATISIYRHMEMQR